MRWKQRERDDTGEGDEASGERNVLEGSGERGLSEVEGKEGGGRTRATLEALLFAYNKKN